MVICPVENFTSLGEDWVAHGMAEVIMIAAVPLVLVTIVLHSSVDEADTLGPPEIGPSVVDKLAVGTSSLGVPLDAISAEVGYPEVCG